jgi:DNA-binding LytR/AlgR family response regulator
MRTELTEITRGQVKRSISLADLTHLRADCKYVEAHGGGKVAILDESLASLEREFGDLLLRTHRGVLVVRSKAVAIERDKELSRHWLHVEGEIEPVPVARRYVAMVREALDSV